MILDNTYHTWRLAPIGRQLAPRPRRYPSTVGAWWQVSWEASRHHPVQAHRTPYRLAKSGFKTPLRCPCCKDPGLVASPAGLGLSTRAVSTFVSLQVATGHDRPLYCNVPRCRRTSRSVVLHLTLSASAPLVVSDRVSSTELREAQRLCYPSRSTAVEEEGSSAVEESRHKTSGPVRSDSPCSSVAPRLC